MSDFLKRWNMDWAADKPDDAAFGQYVETLPTLQNAIDCLPGWNSAFPERFGVTAGPLHLYNDPRIHWEAGRTAYLDAAGAEVDAVEANKLAFMRCLVAKEIYGLARAKFWLGDFVKW